jgi:hypothetical protein
MSCIIYEGGSNDNSLGIFLREVEEDVKSSPDERWGKHLRQVQ